MNAEQLWSLYIGRARHHRSSLLLVRARITTVCSWCALYEWRLVELALTIVRTSKGEWRHWYCHACHSRGWVELGLMRRR